MDSLPDDLFECIFDKGTTRKTLCFSHAVHGGSGDSSQGALEFNLSLFCMRATTRWRALEQITPRSDTLVQLLAQLRPILTPETVPSETTVIIYCCPVIYNLPGNEASHYPKRHRARASRMHLNDIVTRNRMCRLLDVRLPIDGRRCGYVSRVLPSPSARRSLLVHFT